MSQESTILDKEETRNIEKKLAEVIHTDLEKVRANQHLLTETVQWAPDGKMYLFGSDPLEVRGDFYLPDNRTLHFEAYLSGKSGAGRGQGRVTFYVPLEELLNGAISTEVRRWGVGNDGGMHVEFKRNLKKLGFFVGGGAVQGGPFQGSGTFSIK